MMNTQSRRTRAALAAIALTTSTLVGTAVAVLPTTAEAAVPLAISGPATAAAGQPVTLTITGATPGAMIAVFFHKPLQDGYDQRRTLTAGADGSATTSYLAATDERYYTTTDTTSTSANPGLTQITPTLGFNGVQLAPNVYRYTVTGTGAQPYALLHLHRGGPAAPHDIYAALPIHAGQRWSYTFNYDPRQFAWIATVRSATSTRIAGPLLILTTIADVGSAAPAVPGD